MIDQNQVSRLAEFLSSSRSLFFLFANSQQLDLLLAILASYLFCKEVPINNKAKLKVQELAIFCPKKLDTMLNNWPQIKSYLKEQKLLNICQQDLGRENLLISFPYQEEQVNKVSYHIADNDQRFYLTIKPKKGSKPLDYQEVDFKYIGSSADLLILVGVNDLADLKDLYVNYQDLYQDTPLITINTFLPDFGTLNLDISGSSGYGEAVFYLLKSLGNLFNIELKSLNHIKQLATLLLNSISYKTKEFTSPQMTADSFLAIAELLKLEAQRFDFHSLPKASTNTDKKLPAKKQPNPIVKKSTPKKNKK